MPRRNNRRRFRRPEPEEVDPTPSYEALALALVRVGKASPAILGPTRRGLDTHNLALNERQDA